MTADGFLKAVRLRWNVVDYDHRRRFLIFRRCPAAILLILSALIYGRLDRTARACQWIQFRVDAYTGIE